MNSFHTSSSRNSARLIVVMGVAGCGKSTVGFALAERLGKSFLDADDFHPASNVAKMSHGVPLTDDDRWPWLDSIAQALREEAERTGMAIAGCSALRRVYRQRLIDTAGEPITFVFLQGSREIIAERMAERSGHFMPAALLDSQFATLEPPGEDEDALIFDISASIAALAEGIHQQLVPCPEHRGDQKP
jgi:gluconokinase